MRRIVWLLAMTVVTLLLIAVPAAADEPGDDESAETDEADEVEVIEEDDEPAYGTLLVGPMLNPAGVAGGFYTGAGGLLGYMPVTWIGLDLQGEFGVRVAGETHPLWRVSSHFISFLYLARVGASYTRELPRNGREREYLGPELYLQLPLTGVVGGVPTIAAFGLFARYDMPRNPDDQAVFLVGLHGEVLFGFGRFMD